jgi:hypothetical protein
MNEPATSRRVHVRTLAATWSLSTALVASAVAIGALGAWILYWNQGWQYYRTPLRVRAYLPQHALLRPSGLIGHSVGVAGVVMMLVPVLYSIRKKWRRMARVGSMKAWLEVHIFCGIVGPVLVTFHSAMRFNGVISVAYWSMMAVMASGFVGRYLYVRVPRTIRGVELGYDEITARAATLRDSLEGLGLEADAVAGLENLSGGPIRRRRHVRALRRGMLKQAVPKTLVNEAVDVALARDALLRRLAHLQRTRRLFAAWHMFHQPLVYVMFAIALVHIALAVYLGYGFLFQG